MKFYRGLLLAGALVVAISLSVPIGDAVGATPYWLSVEGCEFEVQFPSKPSLSSQKIAGVGVLTTAVGGVEGSVEDTYVLIAEAIPIDMSLYGDIDRKEFILAKARDYAAFNGLEHVEYESEYSPLGYVVSMRGGKSAGGTRVLYSCRIVMGSSSLLMLRAGGAAVSFPQAGVLKFLGSVRKK